MFVTGSNIHGSCGLGEKKSVLQPEMLIENEEIIMAASGYYHNIYLTKNGVYVFGENCNGQLGLGNYQSQYTPTKLNFPNYHLITNLICGHSFTIIVTENKNIYVFGNNASGQIGLPENVPDINYPFLHPFFQSLKSPIKSIGCGGNHTIVVLTNNDVYVFGNNRFGQLSTIKYNRIYQPYKISHNFFNIISVNCGFYFTIIHVTNPEGKEEIYSCGENCFGQLGQNHRSNQTFFNQINFNQQSLTIKSISCGDDHCLILMNNNILYGFGRNKYGQLGIGSNENKLKPTLVKIKKLCCNEIVKFVKCSGNFSICVTNLHVWTFGANKCGQLGLGHFNYCNSPQLVSCKLYHNIKNISCGFSHVLVYCNTNNNDYSIVVKKFISFLTKCYCNDRFGCIVSKLFSGCIEKINFILKKKLMCVYIAMWYTGIVLSCTKKKDLYELNLILQKNNLNGRFNEVIKKINNCINNNKNDKYNVNGELIVSILRSTMFLKINENDIKIKLSENEFVFVERNELVELGSTVVNRLVKNENLDFWKIFWKLDDWSGGESEWVEVFKIFFGYVKFKWINMGELDFNKSIKLLIICEKIGIKDKKLQSICEKVILSGNCGNFDVIIKNFEIYEKLNFKLVSNVYEKILIQNWGKIVRMNIMNIMKLIPYEKFVLLNQRSIKRS